MSPGLLRDSSSHANPLHRALVARDHLDETGETEAAKPGNCEANCVGSNTFLGFNPPCAVLKPLPRVNNFLVGEMENPTEPYKARKPRGWLGATKHHF